MLLKSSTAFEVPWGATSWLPAAVVPSDQVTLTGTLSWLTVWTSALPVPTVKPALMTKQLCAPFDPDAVTVAYGVLWGAVAPPRAPWPPPPPHAVSTAADTAGTRNPTAIQWARMR